MRWERHLGSRSLGHNRNGWASRIVAGVALRKSPLTVVPSTAECRVVYLPVPRFLQWWAMSELGKRVGERKHGITQKTTIGLILVVVALAAFAAVSAVRSSAVSSPTSSHLQTAIIPGTWIYWSCTHGTITWQGVQVCHDQYTNAPACDVYPSCSGTITYTVDSGHSFVSLTASGYASISGKTLTVSCPNIGQHWQGYVTLSTT